MVAHCTARRGGGLINRHERSTQQQPLSPTRLTSGCHRVGCGPRGECDGHAASTVLDRTCRDNMDRAPQTLCRRIRFRASDALSAVTIPGTLKHDDNATAHASSSRDFSSVESAALGSQLACYLFDPPPHPRVCIAHRHFSGSTECAYSGTQKSDWPEGIKRILSLGTRIERAGHLDLRITSGSPGVVSC